MKDEMREAPQLLIVDDEAASRDLLVRALGSSDYTCHPSQSALEAQKIIHQQVPSLVLMDFKMPDIDGLEMLKRIRGDSDPAIAQVPVIMMTGHGENEVLSLEAGADDFVTKPISISVLKARIETQLRMSFMRSQLQKQTEEAEFRRRDLERDLDAARLTQQSLIPQTPPSIRGWEVATCYRPVMQIGGDIYGWLLLKDGRYLFWVADAAGHGTAAALVTTLAKLLFHHASVENGTPRAIMQAVNNDFRDIFGGRSFMTAMAVALDVDSGQASVCGAGHPPLLVTRFGHGTEAIPSSAPPLGLAEQNVQETTVNLARGDAFALYTDGLFQGERLAQARATPAQLAGTVNPFATDAQSLLSQLLNQTRQKTDAAEADDDVAVIVVRRET